MYNEEWRHLMDLKKPRRWSQLLEYRLVETLLPGVFGIFFTVVLVEAIAST
jgi:hypothetical protein